MDVHERLTLETIESHSLLASEHVHRYELAAALCHDARVLDLACGTGYGSRVLAEVAASVTGVDIDVGTIEAARTAFAEEPRMSFVASDATTYLRRCKAGDFDVLVCFEGLEHMEDLEAVTVELARLAGSDTKLIVSLPNSEMWEEDNPYHLTNFSFSEATRLFARLGNHRLLVQNFAEGSLIVDPDDPGSVQAPELKWPERVEVDYVNHYIGLINFTESESQPALSGQLQLAYAPAYNRHVRNIERANQELWRTNARLAWSAFTHTGAAAAARSKRQQRSLDARDQKIAELSARVEELERELQNARSTGWTRRAGRRRGN
jgi:SAM-dependent methyltransferase